MSDVQTAPKSESRTSVVRHADPLGSLRRDVDQMMRQLWRGAPLQGLDWPRVGSVGWAAPAIDFTESDTRYMITAELPGLEKSDVDISVQDGMLVISGEKRTALDETQDNLHVSERRYGEFQRAFALPVDAVESKIDAHFENGVLTITIPRTIEKIESKKIKIK